MHLKKFFNSNVFASLATLIPSRSARAENDGSRPRAGGSPEGGGDGEEVTRAVMESVFVERDGGSVSATAPRSFSQFFFLLLPRLPGLSPPPPSASPPCPAPPRSYIIHDTN